LSRELNIREIKSLTAVAHKYDLLTEVFVHGALCVAFSGQCYSSSVSVGNSGNRGSCSQACRDEYEITETGNLFPLNLKDNSAYFDLPALVDAGVDSLKVEGRIKNAHYVYTVIDTWRQQIDTFEKSGQLQNDDANLHRVFNRDFTNSFLTGELTKDMFIDSPRDYSLKHAIKESKVVLVKDIEQVKNDHFQKKNSLGDELAEKIKDISIAKQTITLSFMGKLDEPLTLTIIVGANYKTHTLKTEAKLISAQQSPIDESALKKSFKNFAFNDFDISNFNCTGLGENLSIPFKEITALKNQATLLLTDSAKIMPHVTLPELVKHKKLSAKPSLSILIADVKDLTLCDLTQADVYFKIPESLKKGCNKHIELLLNNPRLIPWFPAVLIGKDYDESVRILEQVQPKRIVSNNTGIAYKAFEMDIEWIAGPFLNTTNSYALLTLQEELNCAGAFISNEINRMQIKKIARPDNFKLIYSIYHPILLMTSRQCFFQRTVGCDKPSIEDGCMLKCEKSTTITNTKGVSLAIDKQKGGYPSLYNNEQFLNVDIVNDLGDLFDEFFIDLTDIGSGSKAAPDKVQLIIQFESMLNGDETASQNLHQMVELSTRNQYKKGL
jgi:putative protease